ncbi:MAG: hypothetical protein K9K64_01685 [Desulfohalobiaceae bacterium]|nr:hypothetical protein [Desulfohalobiaceae bacterium]
MTIITDRTGHAILDISGIVHPADFLQTFSSDLNTENSEEIMKNFTSPGTGRQGKGRLLQVIDLKKTRTNPGTDFSRKARRIYDMVLK